MNIGALGQCNLSELYCHCFHYKISYFFIPVAAHSDLHVLFLSPVPVWCVYIKQSSSIIHLSLVVIKLIYG